VTSLASDLRHGERDPFEARLLAERIAVLLQASLMIRYGQQTSAAAFVATRLGPRSLAYGALADTTAVAALLDRIELPG
jgi:putative acyl-CoA dehydrogenase